MSKMDLGLESLTHSDHTAFTDDMYVDMQIAEEELLAEIAEGKALLDAYKSFTGLLDVIAKHGSYTGFEELIADKAELDKVVGFDICTASTEQLQNLYSIETVGDVLGKFFAKISAFFGRIGDRISNFFKTILPYKEKYLKELVELKHTLQGRKIDEDKFADKKVSSAMTKGHYTEFTTALKKAHASIVKAVDYANDMNLDNYLEAADNIPDTLRTTLFGTVYWRPYLSWFKSGVVKNLGFKGSDVAGVIDDYIEIINSVADLQGMFARIVSNISKLEQKQSFTRASGDTEKAAEIREAIANMEQFWLTLMETAYAYEDMVRRGMYFATYLGRAAKSCLK